MSTDSMASGAARKQSPSPDHPDKASSPTELSKPSWGYILRKTLREFSDDQCTDLAAGLTYFAVLSMFPAMIAVLSLIGVFGQGQRTVDTLTGIVSEVGPASAADTLEPVIESLTTASGTGIALILGLLGALWSASGYVGAFGRAMNRIYEVEEGRPIWKLRPIMILVTAIVLVLCAIAALVLVLSGGIARTIGDAIGLGSAAVTAWSIAKWPLLAIVVVLILALLYYATPNVKQPKFRWISIGAVTAILIWVVASVAFGFYVGNFSSYNKTYGSLAGVIVFLLWLWITNLALLFGAELDAEMERGRQLQAGIPAEEEIQLPPRDTRNIEKNEAKREEAIRRGRELRADSLDTRRDEAGLRDRESGKAGEERRGTDG